MAAVIHEPGEGERLGSHLRLKLERPELSVTEAVVGPEFEGAGPHYHEHHVDTFYVLEGELEVILGTETLRAGPGASVSVPPGIVHGFTSGDAPRTRYLNFHAPDGGFVEYIRRRIAGDASASFDSIDVGGPAGPAEGTVVEAGGGERLEGDSRVITVRAAYPELCFLEFDARAGFGPIDTHVHEGSTDAFYVLDGSLGLVANGGPAQYPEGSFAAAPPGEEHGILEVRSPVRFLNFHTPDDGFAAFVRAQ